MRDRRGRAALAIASENLRALSVRHVVVGGLAVCANGYPRNTKAVDFLVGDEAFEPRDQRAAIRGCVR
jgi:hypothetical protein